MDAVLPAMHPARVVWLWHSTIGRASHRLHRLRRLIKSRGLRYFEIGIGSQNFEKEPFPAPRRGRCNALPAHHRACRETRFLQPRPCRFHQAFPPPRDWPNAQRQSDECGERRSNENAQGLFPFFGRALADAARRLELSCPNLPHFRLRTSPQPLVAWAGMEQSRAVAGSARAIVMDEPKKSGWPSPPTRRVKDAASGISASRNRRQDSAARPSGRRLGRRAPSASPPWALTRECHRPYLSGMRLLI